VLYSSKAQNGVENLEGPTLQFSKTAFHKPYKLNLSTLEKDVEDEGEDEGEGGSSGPREGKNKKNVENELGRFMEPNSKCSYTSNNPQ
jgi:hypothetical protein